MQNFETFAWGWWAADCWDEAGAGRAAAVYDQDTGVMTFLVANLCTQGSSVHVPRATLGSEGER